MTGLPSVITECKGALICVTDIVGAVICVRHEYYIQPSHGSATLSDQPFVEKRGAGRYIGMMYLYMYGRRP